MIMKIVITKTQTKKKIFKKLALGFCLRNDQTILQQFFINQVFQSNNFICHTNQFHRVFHQYCNFHQYFILGSIRLRL